MHRSLRLFRVEVYVPSPDDGGEGEWIFLEPSPGIKESDTETANSDDLDRDPRARWFCIPERMDGTTKVYATRFARSIASTHYPMAWSDPETDVGVPGELHERVRRVDSALVGLKKY